MWFCCDEKFFEAVSWGMFSTSLSTPLTCIATREYQPYTQAQCGLMWKTQFMFGFLLELKYTSSILWLEQWQQISSNTMLLWTWTANKALVQVIIYSFSRS